VGTNEQRFVLAFDDWFFKIGREYERPGSFFDFVAVTL
jgi:hypothetical protein